MIWLKQQLPLSPRQLQMKMKGLQSLRRQNPSRHPRRQPILAVNLHANDERLVALLKTPQQIHGITGTIRPITSPKQVRLTDEGGAEVEAEGVGLEAVVGEGFEVVRRMSHKCRSINRAT